MNDMLARAAAYFENFSGEGFPVTFQSVPDGLVPSEAFDHHIHKYWELKFLRSAGIFCIQAPYTVHCSTGYDYVLGVTPAFLKIGETVLETDRDDGAYNFLPELLDVLYRLPGEEEFAEIRRQLGKSVLENICLILKKCRNGSFRDFTRRDLCEKVLDHMNTHYFNSRLSVGDIARFAGISPQRLNVLLRRKNGQGIRQNLIRIRLEHAAELLENPGCTVKNAAALTGWKSAFYFSNCFRKQYGCTPGKYHREHLSETGAFIRNEP